MPDDFGNVDKTMWKRRLRYRRAWEGSYDTDAAVLPAGRLKGGDDFARRIAAASSVLSEVDPRLAGIIQNLPQSQRADIVAELTDTS